MKRVVVLSSLVFAASALVGPLLRWTTWPPSKFMEGSQLPIGDFIYYLVLLIWPAQPIAVIEVNTGTVMAAVTSVGVNIFLFSLVGAFAGVLAKWRPALLAFYLLVCVMVMCLVVWVAGGLADINILSLVVAFLLYAIPFWGAAQLQKQWVTKEI